MVAFLPPSQERYRLIRRSLLSIVLIACAFPAPVRAQDRPLRTADPVPLPHGMMSVDLGVDFLHGVSFPLSGLEGDLLRAPSGAFRLGMGGLGEFQVFSGMNLFFIEERGPGPFAHVVREGDFTHDIDDPVVATKIRLQEETARWPATGLRAATRLPSAGQESGLGTDTFDFLLWLLAGKTMRGTRVLANVGLGILPVAEEGESQNDVLVYGLAASRPVAGGWTLAGEIHGRYDTRDKTPRGTENQAQARLGARLARGSLTFDGAIIAGLHEHDPDIGATLGLSWLFRAFP